MRNFIKNGLVNARNKNMKAFDYKYESTNGDIISMKGNIKNGNADFTITRTKVNGHQCSSIPVYGMPLTDKCIIEISELAVENL